MKRVVILMRDVEEMRNFYHRLKHTNPIDRTFRQPPYVRYSTPRKVFIFSGVAVDFGLAAIDELELIAGRCAVFESGSDLVSAVPKGLFPWTDSIDPASEVGIFTTLVERAHKDLWGKDEDRGFFEIFGQSKSA